MQKNKMLIYRMKSLRIILITLLVLLPLGAAAAVSGHYQFHHFDTSSSGLSFNDVRCLLQDSRGYVWVGTRYGLNRFDGSRFKAYHKDCLGTLSDYIYCLYEDSLGNIWVGTGNGVTVYDYAMDSFVPVRSASGVCFAGRIFCMDQDSSQQLWMGAGNACIYSCDPVRRVLQEHRMDDFPDNTMIIRMAIDRNDRIYLSLYCDDIYIYDAHAGSIEPLATGSLEGYFRGDDIAGIVVNPKSNDLIFVAGKRSGLCELDLRKGKVRTMLPPDKNQKYGSIHLDTSYNIWISTTAGLYCYNLPSGDCERIVCVDGDRFSMADSDVSCSMVDAAGNLWVGTTYHGLDCAAVRQKLFHKVYRTSDGESLHACNIKGVVQDSRGRIWLASEKLGLMEYLLDADKLVRRSTERFAAGLTSICLGEGVLWLGSRTGVYRYNPDTGELKYYPSLSSGDYRVTSLCSLMSGRLLVGTTAGVMEYDASRDTFVDSGINCISVDVMAEDSFGVVWMASYSDGLYAWDAHNDKMISHWSGGDFPNMMSSVIVDDSDEVWALSFGSGFLHFDRQEGTFVRFDCATLPSLPSDVFYYAIPDTKGNLWMSTDSGLVCFNLASMTVKKHSSLDGLLDDAYSVPALRLSSGRMLFTSVNGFVMLDPVEVMGQERYLSADITDLRLPSGVVIPSASGPLSCNVNLADTIHLPSGHNSISFFVATPHSMFSPVSLFARLSGRDAQPQEITASGLVSYADLPHGSYTLELLADSGTGGKIQVHKPVNVIIDPPFWQSRAGLAILVLLCSLVLLLLTLYLYRSGRKKQERALQEYKQSKDEELFKEKINFFFNIIHEIKTPLMLIHTPVRNLISMDEIPQGAMAELEVIKNSSDYMDNLVKELLEYVRMEEFGYTAHKHNMDLIERLQYICLNFKDAAKNRNITLSLFHEGLDSLVMAADIKALNKIFTNLLHNAVKYAQSRIDVCVSLVGDNLVRVSFSNDGETVPEDRRREIFKPFVQFSEDKAPYTQSFGIGLSLARSLAEAQGGSLVLEPSEQTEFVLTLPLEVFAEAVRTDDALPVLEQGASSKHTVLLVEDNADLLSYLALKLGDEYNVVPAASAESALDIVDKRKIDIIATDIGLSAMSGIDLCRKICSNFTTSHIPVVMISAISSEQTKIKCMEMGASVYIEKPFTIDYLKACIAGILSTRSSLKTHLCLSGVERTDLSAFNIEDKDSAFLSKLESIVMKHIAEDDFSVKQLESELYMSHTALNKKMNGLLNMAPVDYIRTKRLSIAAHLIASGEARINEVCYSVGFTSPSYFTKCFKSIYGVTPSKYAVEHCCAKGE